MTAVPIRTVDRENGHTDWRYIIFRAMAPPKKEASGNGVVIDGNNTNTLTMVAIFVIIGLLMINITLCFINCKRIGGFGKAVFREEVVHDDMEHDEDIEQEPLKELQI